VVSGRERGTGTTAAAGIAALAPLAKVLTVAAELEVVLEEEEAEEEEMDTTEATSPSSSDTGLYWGIPAATAPGEDCLPICCTLHIRCISSPMASLARQISAVPPRISSRPPER
jgi:hypothetical protein